MRQNTLYVGVNIRSISLLIRSQNRTRSARECTYWESISNRGLGRAEELST
jgi:hypothetical protein